MGKIPKTFLNPLGVEIGPSAEADDFVVVAQPAAVGVGGFEDVVDHDAAVGVAVHRGAERGVIDDPAAVERAEEVLDLVDRDGVARADVHPAALLERAAAVDADQAALGVEQRAAGVAGVDRGVGLDAVGVFQQRAGRKLVAMHAGDDAVGDRGLQIGGQQERVAHGEDPIARADLVAVAQFGAGEIVAAEELDQGHVAGRIDADQHGVVDAAVGHAALHRLAAGHDDVEIGQGVAVGRDDHARAAALSVGREDGQHAVLGLVHRGDALGLGVEDRRRPARPRRWTRLPDSSRQRQTEQECSRFI